MLLYDEPKMTSDAIRYGFAVGKIRVLESRALDAAAFERLLDAPTFAEQKRQLSETPYGGYLEHAETAEDVERGLTTALDDFYGFLGAATLPEAVTRYFLVRYDFANLKAAAKARLLSVSLEGLLVAHGTVPLEAYSGDLAALPAPLGALAKSLPIEAALSDGVVTDAETMTIDTLVDRAMFDELVRVAKAAKSSYLVELSRLAVDVANARVLMRARFAGLPSARVATLLMDGGTVPVADLVKLTALPPAELANALGRVPSLRGMTVADLERADTLDLALDAVTAAAWRRGRMGGQVGPEPVISYVLAREAEVARLRVVLLGRLAGIDNEKLRARVRAAA